MANINVPVSCVNIRFKRISAESAALCAPFLFAAAVLLAAVPVRAEIGPLDFDGVKGGAINFSVLKEAVPAPVKSVSRAEAPLTFPELKYESLLLAPLWKSSQGEAVSADLSAGFSAARSQGNRNICSAFAATGLAEFLVNEKEGTFPLFSEEFLFYNAKYDYTDQPGLQDYKTETGLPGYVATLALGGGVTSAKDWPFVPKWVNPSPQPPVTDAEVGIPPEGIKDKVLGYKFAPLAIRRSEIKDFILSERRPVVFNLMVYLHDWTGNGATPGRFTQPNAEQKGICMSTRENCGGHVVLLVGYDKASGDFIFRNSWGAKWGNSGYGRISEKYVLEDCEACGYASRLEKLNPGSRSLIVNTLYGWSAELK